MKRTVYISKEHQKPDEMNMGVAALQRFEKKLRRGKNYDGGTVLQIIADQPSPQLALSVLLEALQCGTPSAKVRKRWIAAAASRGVNPDVIEGAIAGAKLNIQLRQEKECPSASP